MLKHLLIFMILAGCAFGQDETAAKKLRDTNLAEMRRQYEENLTKYAGNTDFLVLPGLTADRKTKTIHILGEATGLGAGEILEFYLIGEKSGHDYESLMVALARPSDIHRALEFIGMQKGRPIHYGKMMFWPKGERVLMYVDDVRIEKMLTRSNDNKPVKETGLVFVGSMMIPDMENGAMQVYAADAQGPHSIASNYNEPFSIMDVPGRAPQASVYRQFVVSSAHVMKSGRLLNIKLVPEYRDGKKRVQDLTLSVKLAEPGDSAEKIHYCLSNGTKKLSDSTDINAVLKTFVELTGEGFDPFVSFEPTQGLTVAQVRQVAQLLSSIESENGIRVEPPAEGHIYFKAFLPDEKNRKRSDRIGQPWELKLTSKTNDVSGVLTWIRQVWKKQEIYPELLPLDYMVKSPEEARKTMDTALRKETTSAIPLLADVNLQARFRKELEAMTDLQLWGKAGENLRDRIDEHLDHLMTDDIFQMRSIFVFCKPDLKYGELMTFLKPLQPTHSMIHVYIETEDGI